MRGATSHERLREIPDENLTTMKALNLSLLLILCLVSAKAGAARSRLEGFEDSPTAGRFSVVDERPEKAKKASIGSLLPLSCDYGVRRISDESTDPDRIRLLRSDLDMATGAFLNGKTVHVRHFGVYVNAGVETRRQVNEQYRGL